MRGMSRNAVGATIAVTLFASLALTSCRDADVSGSACAAYVQYPDVQAIADDAQLVARATIQESQSLHIRIDDVKKGDVQLAGTRISVEAASDCGTAPSSTAPGSFSAGSEVIVFLVHPDGADWRPINPTQGIQAFDQTVYNSITA